MRIVATPRPACPATRPRTYGQPSPRRTLAGLLRRRYLDGFTDGVTAVTTEYHRSIDEAYRAAQRVDEEPLPEPIYLDTEPAAEVVHPAWCTDECPYGRTSGMHTRTVGEIDRDPTGSTGAGLTVRVGDSQWIGDRAPDPDPYTWVELKPHIWEIGGDDTRSLLDEGGLLELTTAQARQLALLLLDAVDVIEARP